MTFQKGLRAQVNAAQVNKRTIIDASDFSDLNSVSLFQIDLTKKFGFYLLYCYLFRSNRSRS